MKKILFVLASAVISCVNLYGQSKMSNYTSVLVESRKASMEEFSRSPMSKVVKTVNGTEYVDCFVHFVGGIDEAVLEEYGAKLHCRYDFMNVATAAVPFDALEALAADARIKLVEAGTPVKQELDKARTYSHVDEVNSAIAPLTKSYKGKGVVVGVVDRDMQFDHPAFWDQAHKNFRIKRVWNQNKSGGTSPSQFSYGSEYKDSASIMQQKYDTRQMTSGHATHVAGIAVGADHSENYFGVAQEADIVFVSDENTNSTGIPDGIKYCFDYAASVNKPCVVNVSMGMVLGPHDGTSTESQIIDGLVGRGRIAVGSAGNSGDTKQHAGKVINSTDTDYITFVSFKEPTSQYYNKGYAYIDIYGDVNQVYKVQVVAYNKDAKECAYASAPFFSNATTPVNANADTVMGTYGRLKFKARMTPETTTANRGHITLIFNTADSIPKRHNIGIRISGVDSGMVNMWSMEDLSVFENANQKQILDGNTDYTVGEPMGVTEGVISVGSYVTNPKTSSAVLRDISGFSSKGPTADNRIKPDITAPGEYLMSAYPDIAGIKDGRSVTVNVGGTDYYYGLMQGTSMSSPFCAGVIATWLEADSTLDADRIRDVFFHTAFRDDKTGHLESRKDNTWGYGKINSYAGLLYILGLTTQVQDVEEKGVLVAYPNPTSDVLNIGFPGADSNVRVAIYDLSGKCVYSENMEETVAGQSLEISVSNLATGAYIVKVAGQKINDTFKLIKE